MFNKKVTQLPLKKITVQNYSFAQYLVMGWSEIIPIFGAKWEKNGDLVQGMELLLYNQEDRKRENMFEKKAVLRLSLEDHYLHFIGALENSPLRSFIKFSKQTKKK